ncbi:hypothetical protein CCH79_00002503 [Gambusia affinis]|uniref:Uncharacterized protein n=1 Tax=Gambusia affinis TaxID=33528 RepID=A0A315VI89_GAMAF|nr:hypothetical protein CCH79_00002503 [Gambusia affinis]
MTFCWFLLPEDRRQPGLDFNVSIELLLTGRGRGEDRRQTSAKSENRTRDRRVEDRGPPDVGRAVPYATTARPS